jgi:hypothetical protein
MLLGYLRFERCEFLIEPAWRNSMHAFRKLFQQILLKVDLRDFHYKTSLVMPKYELCSMPLSP